MKKAVTIIAAVLVILLPLGIVLGMLFMLPPQYSNTFVGELDEKYERLMEIDEPKIVVVGGSSVAFGLESEIIEEYTGMPVVNFGLYAALGTKLMLDLSRKGINEGDIVVLAPELDPQTMSMYFSSETTLQAMDDKPSMIRHLKPDNLFSVIGALFKHSAQKLEYMRDGAPNPSGVYNSKNFNEYGDLEYDRPENAMALYYDPNTMINLNESILDGEFIDYLNDYIKYCERRGATVYYSYCPMNHMALAEGTTEQSIAEFEAVMKERIKCRFISSIGDYIMHPGYFYDTNFHLNNDGSVFRTLKLCDDLLLAMEKPVMIDPDLYPAVPELFSGMIEVSGELGDHEFFTYTQLSNGNYMITGLTEAGKQQETLTVPLGVPITGSDKGAAVTIIGEGAFAGGAVKTVIIPKESYVTQMNNGVFTGASTVTELKIYKPEAETLNPPVSFAGVAEGFVIHAPDGSDYTTGYFWSQLKGVTIILDLES